MNIATSLRHGDQVPRPSHSGPHIPGGKCLRHVPVAKQPHLCANKLAGNSHLRKHISYKECLRALLGPLICIYIQTKTSPTHAATQPTSHAPEPSRSLAVPRQCCPQEADINFDLERHTRTHAHRSQEHDRSHNTNSSLTLPRHCLQGQFLNFNPGFSRKVERMCPATHHIRASLTPRCCPYTQQKKLRPHQALAR